MVKENKKVEDVKEVKSSNNKKECNKKKLIIIIASAVVLITGIIILIICLCGKKSNEEELKNNLKKLGSQFYEEFYYPTQENSQKDIKEFIAKFEKTGIKVNLENIAKISKVDKKLIESMVNKKTDEKCDEKETYVVVKPVSPYGKDDYKIEVKLSCGFENKETKKSSASVNLAGFEDIFNTKKTTSKKTTATTKKTTTNKTTKTTTKTTKTSKK